MLNLILLLKSQLKQRIPIRIAHLFSHGHERSIEAKKNILASFVIRGFSIVISLLLVPLTIHYVNPTRYGIWITLSSIVGWLSFFDIGIGNGLRNKFTEALAKGDFELARIYVSTTYAIITIIITFILVLFLIINPFLNWARILNTPPEMVNELSILALVVFVFFCIQFILQLITTIITADQKPAKASLFNLLSSFFSLIVIFILTKITSGSLLYLGVTLSVTPVIVLVASSFWFYSKDYKIFAPSIKYVKFKFARNLMNLGIKFFIIQIAAVILYQTSNMIIAQLFGPAEVTPFNIAYKYFGIMTMIFSVVMTPFWSAFTDAYARNDLLWIRKIMKKLQLFWMLMAMLTVLMLFFSDFIYKIWVGKAINIPFALSIIIAVYVILNSWCAIYCQFLNGVGKIKLQLYSAILGGIINIPLAIFLGKLFGTGGVILSTVAIGTTGAVWAPIQYYKIINGDAKGIWAK